MRLPVLVIGEPTAVPYGQVRVGVAAQGPCCCGRGSVDLSVRVNGMSLARRVTTRLVDDLDGSDAVATVSFSLDGRSFEIDLSERHLAEFRTVLEPFVTAARCVSGASGGRPPVVEPTPAQAVAQPDVSSSRPERKGKPLVADPFNPQVRIV